MPKDRSVFYPAFLYNWNLPYLLILQHKPFRQDYISVIIKYYIKSKQIKIFLNLILLFLHLLAAQMLDLDFKHLHSPSRLRDLLISQLFIRIIFHRKPF